MLHFLQFIYNTFLLPPGIIILALMYLCFITYYKKRKCPKFLIIVTIILYTISISWFGDLLIRSLESRYTPPTNPSGDVIVMLGGGALADVQGVHGNGQLSGNAANKLLMVTQLYHRTHLPIILSGGQVYETTGNESEIGKSILLSMGIPEDKIIIENSSRNTTENAMFTKKIIEAYGFNKLILVTSAFHMQRSVLQFNKVGLEVTPYPTDYQANKTATFEAAKLWPNSGALQNVSLAIKEYIGILASKWY